MLLRVTGGNGVLGKLLTFVFWCRESGIVFAVIELVGMTVISAVVLTGSTTAAFIFL